MVELVALTKSGILTDSYILSESFSKKHEYIIRKTEQLIKKLGARKFATKTEPIILEKYKEYRGQKFKYYKYDRKAFSLLVMSFTGEKAFEWQEKFYDAFSLMEKVLLNNSDPGWKQVRTDGKLARLEFTGCVKEFTQYADSQGSKSSFRYYTNLTKMEYKALKLIEKNEKVPEGFRNTLDKMELFMIIMAEHVANEAMKEGMNQKLHYKEIFVHAKNAVLKYADSVLFTKKEIE